MDAVTPSCDSSPSPNLIEQEAGRGGEGWCPTGTPVLFMVGILFAVKPLWKHPSRHTQSCLPRGKAKSCQQWCLSITCLIWSSTVLLRRTPLDVGYNNTCLDYFSRIWRLLLIKTAHWGLLTSDGRLGRDEKMGQPYPFQWHSLCPCMGVDFWSWISAFLIFN